MIYSIHEGKQADEYRARKAKEAEEKTHDNDRRYCRRYMDDSKAKALNGYITNNTDTDRTVAQMGKALSKNYRNNSTSGNKLVDKDHEDRMRKKFGDENEWGIHDTSRDKDPNIALLDPRIAADAANRHERRHPNKYKNSSNTYSRTIPPAYLKKENSIFEYVELI